MITQRQIFEISARHVLRWALIQVFKKERVAKELMLYLDKIRKTNVLQFTN